MRIARRLDAVPRRELLAQRPVAAAGAVGQDRPAVALERGARAVGELVDREALGRGHAAGERDHFSRDRDHLRDLGRRRAD